MIKIVKLTQTCTACPAQWEAISDDNRPLYIRYRHGSLDIHMGPVDGDLDSALDGEEVFSWESDDVWDGFMTFEQLKELTKDKIEFAIEKIEEKTTFYLVNMADGTKQEFDSIEEALGLPEGSITKKDE